MSTFTNSLIMRDFPSFCHAALQICRDGDVLNPDPYLLQVFAMAEDIAEGRVIKAAIAMPPGTAKTFIFAVCLPAWILAHKPSTSIMLVEHNEKLANDSARNILKILSSQIFQRNFMTRLDPNWRGTGNFGTTKGGSVYAVTVAGGITGFRADVIIVDDPLAIKHANNERQIDFVNATFENEILSRARDEDSRVIVVMHRLNENDLIGYVSRLGGYKKLTLPLIANRNCTYKCRYGVWHRKKNELLRPNRYDKHELRNLAFKPSFRYLYQQGKAGGASLRIKAKFFSHFDGLRDASLPIVFSIDTAQKAGDHSSRMVIQIWQTTGRDHYLLQVFAEVCDYQKLWNELERLVKRYPPSVMLIEDASNGSALISQLGAVIDCEIRPVVPRGSKSTRFRPHFNTIRRGRVHVPISTDWVTGFIEEIRAFPEGNYDDHVDCLSMFLDFMALRPKLTVRRLARERALGVRTHNNGIISQIVPRVPGLLTRFSRDQRPAASGTVGGRASLDSVPSVRLETRFGPVIVRGR